MPTTAEYLATLTNLKATLATNLTNKGVPASSTEQFNTLVPKVLDIEGITGEVRNETLTSQSGTYTPSSGKNAITKITVTAQSGSVSVPSQTVTANPSALTYDSGTGKYITTVSQTATSAPNVSTGWVTTGSSGTITISGRLSVNVANWSTTTETATYTSLNKNQKYKLSAGYYAEDRYFQTQGDPSLSGDAVEANVLSGKTFYSNSYTKKTGSMPNNGATGTTITTQGGTYNIPSGYTSGGTVTVNIPSATYTTGNNISINLSESDILSCEDGELFLSKANYGNNIDAIATAGYATENGSCGVDVDMMGSINLKAYDSNLIASNIANGVNILGITGTALVLSGETRTVTLNNKTETYTPSTGKNAITSITVTAKTGSVNTPATTIKTNPTLSTTYTSGKGYLLSVSASQSVTPNVGTAGWISSGTAGTVKVQNADTPAYVPQTSFLPTTDTQLAAVLEKNTKYKLSAGYYPTDRYYQTPEDTPATYSNLTSSGTNRLSIITSSGYITAPLYLNDFEFDDGQYVFINGARVSYIDSIRSISIENTTFTVHMDADREDNMSVEVDSSGSLTVTDANGRTEDLLNSDGSLNLSKYYTGSSDPSSSLGVNGDIYLKTA